MVKNDRVYKVCIHIILIIISLLCILPFVLLIAVSFTGEQSLITNGYSFFPKEFSIAAYQYCLAGGSILKAYGVTFLVTAVGTATSLLVTTLISYPLSMRDLPGQRLFNFLIFFTMLFSGGLIPSYMMWTHLFHIKNTFMALIIPGLITNGFTIMIMRTYFSTNILKELLESARIDGETEMGILFRIVIPLSLPIMATIGLTAGIMYWNDWTNNLYYITNPDLNSVQALLNKMLSNAQYMKQVSNYGAVNTASLPTISTRMAVAVLGAVPLMCIYPFFQKHFAKGLTLGAVKG